MSALGDIAYFKVKKILSQLGSGGLNTTVCKQTVDSSVSGTVAQTILCSLLIPAGTMGANDIGSIEAVFYKTGSTDGATWTMFISPNNNSLTGASSIGNAINSGAQLFASMHRTIANKNSQSTNYSYVPSGGVENPWVNANNARNSINQNFANNLYLIVTCQMGGTTDTGGLDHIYFNKITT